MNVIINARDAMPGGGTITITGENSATCPPGMPGRPPAAAIMWCWPCRIWGTGISAELLDRVMEPFFTTKEVGKGTGLGLSMVYGFAQQSGGTLRIESEMGVGTRVEIWLPRPCRGRGCRRSGAEGSDLPAVSKSLRVLLVDDHVGARVTAAALLEDMGHEVIQAVDGAKMLDILRAAPGRFDLIISDYAMPLISGAEGIRQAREISSDIPAILVTGYAEAASVSIGRAMCRSCPSRSARSSSRSPSPRRWPGRSPRRSPRHRLPSQGSRRSQVWLPFRGSAASAAKAAPRPHRGGSGGPLRARRCAALRMRALPMLSLPTAMAPTAIAPTASAPSPAETSASAPTPTEPAAAAPVADAPVARTLRFTATRPPTGSPVARCRRRKR